MGGCNAIIEGDSFSAIQWGSRESSYPWRWENWVKGVQDILSQLNAPFNHILWEANDMEDGLAMEGVFHLNISFDVWFFALFVFYFGVIFC